MLTDALKGKGINFTVQEKAYASGEFETMNREGDAIPARALDTP